MFYVAAMANHPSQSGGEDIFFIIRANSLEQAVELADSQFMHFPNYSKETHSTYSIQELHDLPSKSGEDAYVVHGPFDGLNTFQGRGRFLYRNFRDAPWEEDPNTA